MLEGVIVIYRTSKQTQMRKDRKRRHILDCASELFAERGYAGTTVQDIIRRSGISTGSFYFYFKSKDMLFECLYDEFSTLLDRVSEFAMKKAANEVIGFCRSKASELWVFQKNKGLAKAMMIEAAGMNPKFLEKRAGIFKKSDERIERIFSSLEEIGFKSPYDPKTGALICNGTLYYIIIDWLHGDCRNKLTDYAKPITIYNLNAFRLDHDEGDVAGYIEEMLYEMENLFK